ncbi:hypothetical protein KP509_22G053000 [Ceratopteris richardii]|uniref:Xyloglucan endotransglucosylase/hydrolase n=1 Tax=Ceratopteris richardii TaxID=49495 RepID=A0A8T2S750_CERRI|nr:hypothetical protein KP509_22G053000 [Ceratopteris richardii]
MLQFYVLIIVKDSAHLIAPFAGSGFKSKRDYLFGSIDMDIQLVPGNSAGTVTAYYLSSLGANHDELDFEFLGNETGQPYIVQTNIFVSGVGGREQRHYLWFDPTVGFHKYSFRWSTQDIFFLVDGVPIRHFKKSTAYPYPERQPMGLYSSLWNGDDWATRGGLVKIDWRYAPFVASYRNFRVVPASAAPPVDLSKLAWVNRNYMVYNYCTDRPRYPTTPPDCM